MSDMSSVLSLVNSLRRVGPEVTAKPEASKAEMHASILRASGLPWEVTVKRLRDAGLGLQATFELAERSGDAEGFWREVEAEVDLMRSDRLRNILKACGPAPLADMTGEKLEGLSRHKALRDALSGWDDSSLLLLGPTGCGKTATAAALVRRSKLSTTWYSGDALLRSIRRHPLGHGDPPELERAIVAPLLVVDDPDWIRSSDADEVFALVCAERERRGRPVIVTSGATREQFVGRYGGAVLRRIVESSRNDQGAPTGRVVDCHSGR